MGENLILHYDISGDDFTRAGEASSDVKNKLKVMGVDNNVIRKVAIAMYEGEINMVIHASGGVIDVYIDPDSIEIIMADTGPGIADIEKAWQEGYTTASQTVRDLGFGAGMGLPNMKRYSDFIDIETELGKGTTVKMIIKTRS